MTIVRQSSRDIFDELWDGAGPSSTADEIWRLMNQLTFGAGMDRIDEVADQVGLNRTQARLLMQLGSRDPWSQREVAATLHLDPSTITIIADHLESLKLVSRRTDENDRRGRLLILTGKGKRARRRLIDGLFSVPAAVAALTEADQVRLRDLLRQLATSR